MKSASQTSLTPFTGRNAELRALADLFQHHQLITLTAPGGMGKTRLALEAATAAQPAFEDGVVVIVLPAAADMLTVITRTADALGFTFHHETSLSEQLLDYLHDKKLLLLFDNLDTPQPETVTWLAALAAAGPTLFITARERMQVSGETVYPLHGLAPDDALALFAQTARRVQPNFSLDISMPVARRICQRLGGMPLAVMLAAAWVEVLSLEEIETEIAADLNFLQADFHDLPEQHHNLKTLLAASWVRLNAAEGETLARLAVFQGGFTRTAAHAVAAIQPAMLKTFISRSLLWRDPASERYNIHELLRQYALSQLSAHEPDARKRHADYFAQFVAQQRDALQNQHQREAASLLNADWENISAAWAWAVQTGNSPNLDLMIEPLYLLLNMQSKWTAGEALFLQAAEQWRLQHADDAIDQRLALRGVHLLLLGHDSSELTPNLLAQVRSVVSAALAVPSSEAEHAFARYVYGHLLIEVGDYTGAVTSLQESLTLYHHCEQPYFIAHVYHLLGFVSIKLDSDAQALVYAQQSVAIGREIGDKSSLSMFLVNTGSFLMWQGRYAEARQCFEEAMEDPNWSRVLWAEQCLGSLAFYTADFDAVRQSALKVLAMSKHYGYRSGLELGTQNLFIAALAEGDYSGAKAIYQTSEVISATEREFGLAMAEIGLNHYAAVCGHLRFVFSEGEPGRWIYALCGAAWVLVQRGDFPFAVELLSLVWHHHLRSRVFSERVALVNNLRLFLEKRLPPHLFAEMWARGKTLPIELAVQRTLPHLTVLDPPPHLQITWEPLDTLSDREHEILALVAKGLSNQAIADQLVIGVNTVKKHLTHIYSKLGVINRTQALIRARELNLI